MPLDSLVVVESAAGKVDQARKRQCITAPKLLSPVYVPGRNAAQHLTWIFT